MELQPGLIQTKALDVEATRHQAEQIGYNTFVLPADGIIDRISFFNAIRTTLPLDPPLIGSRSWDAMSDSLWEGLYTLPDIHIAIIWPNARVMASMAPSDFEIALNVLKDITILLADPHTTNGKPKRITVIVECW